MLLISSCSVISRQCFVVPNIFFSLRPRSSVTLSSVRHACAIALKVTACSYCHWLSLSHTSSRLLPLSSFKSFFDTLFFLHVCEYGLKRHSWHRVSGTKASQCSTRWVWGWSVDMDIWNSHSSVGMQSTAWFSQPNCAPRGTIWGKKQVLKLVAVMPFKFRQEVAPKCLTFHCSLWQHVANWNMFEWEEEENGRRMIKETANTGVALYLLGRWGLITANFNQFRSIIHGQGPSKLISKMPRLSLPLSDSRVWIIQSAFTQNRELHLWYLISQLETLCNREWQLEIGKRVSWYEHKHANKNPA